MPICLLIEGLRPAGDFGLFQNAVSEYNLLYSHKGYNVCNINLERAGALSYYTQPAERIIGEANKIRNFIRENINLALSQEADTRRGDYDGGIRKSFDRIIYIAHGLPGGKVDGGSDFVSVMIGFALAQIAMARNFPEITIQVTLNCCYGGSQQRIGAQALETSLIEKISERIREMFFIREYYKKLTETPARLRVAARIRPLNIKIIKVRIKGWLGAIEVSNRGKRGVTLERGQAIGETLPLIMTRAPAPLKLKDLDEFALAKSSRMAMEIKITINETKNSREVEAEQLHPYVKYPDDLDSDDD